MTVIHVCKMIISSGVFSIFLKILIFWVHRVVKKGKKQFRMRKNYLSRSISQEPYIIWLPFMVQMCKMIIYPGVVFHCFLGCQGVEKPKNGPKSWKFLSVTPYISGTIYDLHLWYTCMYKRIISPGIFLHFFQNFDIWDH